ncbi:hypothetical protein CS022_08300 [Veronia nyctiphanis]|uniref:Endonuclease/exonuclease/phosphatase domain-containing protein n=1 Tax=Veronia nyctiphanis TaxID=1278244 RepID=A0A4Q0YSR9_9GAMM|nr:endonuclease/exonuclease/phosphatase family protein [Veronia nyctiphanis]RXJ73723.1 hypothetical protein CS022_08300 [Veronia nyctiphanis]
MPVLVGGQRINILACHPTPPVFDGKEKRNLRRNADELRLLRDIVDGADYLSDDAGSNEPLEDAFIIIGDLNADNRYGDGDRDEIQKLLTHPRIHPSTSTGSLIPFSKHGSKMGKIVKGNRFATHESGLRLDYVLPSKELEPFASSVICTVDDLEHIKSCDSNMENMSCFGSDHRLVMVDVVLKSGDIR